MEEQTRLSRLFLEASQGRLTRRDVLKRTAALGLSAPLISAFLAACGGDDDDDDDGGDSGTDEPTATEATDGGAEDSASPTSEGDAEATEGGDGGDSEPTEAEEAPTEGETGEVPAADRETLIFGSDAADMGVIDPHFASATVDRIVVDMTYNGLIRFAPGNSQEMEPDLAEEVPAPEMVDGKQVWTFPLRQGVMWQPGPQTESYELTASDVIYSLQKAADPERSAFSAEYEGLTFEQVDDYTVTITADPPLSETLFLPKVANYAGGFIVSEQAVEAMGDDELKAHPVGTGPFMFQNYRAQDGIDFVAWDDYFRGAPKIAGVNLRFVSDSTSRELALQSGELHVASGLPEAQWAERVDAMDGLGVDIFGVGEVAFLNFNMGVEPLSDLNVRKALAHAISRDGHLALFGPPVAENVYSVVPAQFLAGGLTQEEAQENGVEYPQDLDLSKQLLADAGYADGFSFDIVTSETAYYRRNFEALQAEFAEIGVEMNIEVVDHPTYHSLIREDANPIVIYAAWRPNAQVYLTHFFHSDSIVVTGANPITNFSHYDQIDDLIEEAALETDPDAQADLWQQANIRILEDLAAFPLHYINQVYARSDSVDYGHELVSTLALYPQFTEMTTFATE